MLCLQYSENKDVKLNLQNENKGFKLFKLGLESINFSNFSVEP